MASSIWLAVDTPDIARARALVAATAPWLGGVKLGLEFFVANGPRGVEEVMAGTGLPLFLDLKLHDIPNTVAKAVESAARMQPALLTIHASGGAAMIAAAKEAALKAGGPGMRIIAVTVLTSLDAVDLAGIGLNVTPAAQVARLAGLAAAAGADGMVCSPHEVAAARARWPEGFMVVPGVRPAGAAADDQKRVMTPAEALAAGATALVVGRPVTAAADPAAAAAAIAASL
ncbi:orotidine-5'-phosphate decarboxylase [Sandaracinobacteroides sp. A072]|uniref:orotidine-5'-phosphate decarboxylase n=1 Tax=Sandaracinobacteroides sp. A072 TaxID=3461146 RepID=UPI0040428095